MGVSITIVDNMGKAAVQPMLHTDYYRSTIVRNCHVSNKWSSRVIDLSNGFVIFSFLIFYALAIVERESICYM